MMETTYQLITTAEELRRAVEELAQQPVLGFDSETTSLDPFSGRLRLIQLGTPDGFARIFDLDRFSDGDPARNEALEPLRRLLAAPRPIKVGHNLKFDAKWVRKHLGVEIGGLFDTLLASQLISAGNTDERHSLEVVAARFLGETVDKSQQVSDWGGELSEAQLEYAARDGIITLPLREKQIERLKALDLVRCATLEFDCVMPVAALELAGIFLDTARWREQMTAVEKRRAVLAEELQEMLAVGTVQGSLFANARADINLDSHTQLSAALKRLNIPIPDSTRNWKLQPLAAEYPVIAKLLDYRTVQKSLTSYGANILDEINPATGRIHANFHQIGAPTGRMACLAGETLVATPQGCKELRFVRAGDRVKTSYGFRRVEAAWMSGIKPVFKMSLRDGRAIRATADHLFLAGRADCWKRLDELRPGEQIFLSFLSDEWERAPGLVRIEAQVATYDHRKQAILPSSLSVALCELLGLIVADGFLGKRHVRPARRRLGHSPATYDRVLLAFNPRDEDLIARITRYGQELFGHPFKEVKSRSCRVLQLASTQVAEFLAALGMEGDARTKRVPVAVLGAPPAFQAAFLRGLFEGDGHRARQTVGLTSVNRPLLAQAQLMLSNLGIRSLLAQRNDKSGFAGGVRFSLMVSGKANVARFLERVGFMSQRKNGPCLFKEEVTDGRLTPFVLNGAQLFREAAAAAGLSERSRRGTGSLSNYYRGKPLKDCAAERLLARFGPLTCLLPVKAYLARELSPVEVVCIEPDGVEPVYDITVEETHEFIANGIVVHNCTQPNIQQVPHSIEYRRCFRAPEGRKLCISDYSQIELRILADFTGDQGFIDAFNSGADLHRVTAAQVFGVPLDQVSADQRSFAKRLNFGVVYGIGAQRFALMTGVSVTEAEDILRKYFATYRALDAWLRNAAIRAVREREARTVSGRLARFNFDPADRQAVSLAQRNGKNTPIQGCVSGGTRILTAEHGYVPIAEVAGQDATVWDGHEFARASVAQSGFKRLVKVTLWGGHYIECSPDHRFRTVDANGRGRWLRAEQLAGLKQIYVDTTAPAPAWELPFDLRVFAPKDLQLRHQPVAKPHNAKTLSLSAFDDRFRLGMWLGRLASDGSVSSLDTKRPGNVALMIAEHEEAIMPEMEAMTGTFGYYGKRTKITETQPGAFRSLIVGSISLTRQLLHYGIKDRVPDFLWRSKSALRGYLRGMFDGDGTVNIDGPVLTFGKGPLYHLAWARQIQQALLLFGVRSRLNPCHDRINVRVLKRDAPVFAAQIGFMHPAKQANLAAVRPRSPAGCSQIYGRAARVKSVEITNTQVEMYDVVDSATGRFMANGLITHNSSADIIKRALRLLHDKLKDTSACIVNVIHDEIVVEADAGDAETVARMVEEAMRAAGEEYVKKVPIKVETEIADEWVKS